MKDFENDEEVSNVAVTLMHHDGTIAGGWPIIFEDDWIDHSSLGDLDGDGDLEVVIAGSSSGEVNVYEHDGTIAVGWPQSLNQWYSWDAAVLADVDGDGDVEVIKGSSDGKLYICHHNGTLVDGFPKKISFQDISATPAIGDIDADGDIDIVLKSYSFPGQEHVYALSLNGGYDPFNIHWAMSRHDERNTGRYIDPKAPTLVDPGYNALLPEDSPPAFQWESGNCRAFKVEFYGKAGFKGGKIVLPKRRWADGNYFTPTRSEWKEIKKRLLGEDGQVYWRVRGRDANNITRRSEIRNFSIE